MEEAERVKCRLEEEHRELGTALEEAEGEL